MSKPLDVIKPPSVPGKPAPTTTRKIPVEPKLPAPNMPPANVEIGRTPKK